MNNKCPKCDQVYNVSGKDIGRRIKCKMCGTSLEVRGTGLEIEDPNAPPVPAPSPPADDDLDDKPRKKRDRDSRPSMPAMNPMEILAKIGGIPTALFAFGLLIVIFTGFQESIGKAKIDRRQAAIEEVQAKLNAAQRKYDEKKEKTDEDTKNLMQTKESLEKEKKIVEEEKTVSEIANKRSGYIDRYYLLFGFLLISFGCLGYLLGEYGMVLRIVAAVIVLFMVMALFKGAVGVGAGVSAGIGLG